MQMKICNNSHNRDNAGDKSLNNNDLDGRIILIITAGLIIGGSIVGGLYICLKSCDAGAKNIGVGIKEANQSKIDTGINQMKAGVDLACATADAGLLALDGISGIASANGITKSSTSKISGVESPSSFNKSANRFQTTIPVQGAPGRPFVKNSTGVAAATASAASMRTLTTTTKGSVANTARHMASELADNVASEMSPSDNDK